MRVLSSDLNDRTLRFDGVSILEPELVAAALIKGVQPSAIRVRGTSAEIETFNAEVTDIERIKPEAVEPVNLSMAWQLPEKYKNLDLWNVILDTFFNRLESLGYEEAVQQEAFARLFDEYDEIKRRGRVEFIRTVIYVLDTFREKGVVWGVGRGSSCASYTLFILGLHVVDCVCLKVPMEEFFHD